MFKYLIVCLILLSSSAVAQSYKASIAKHRENYQQDFIDNPRSPLKKEDLKNLHFFRPNETYRVTAKITLLNDHKPIKVPTSSGIAKIYFRYAEASFQLKEKNLKLTLFKSEALAKDPKYADYLFLPFTDQTNHKTTYGGGRYLDLNLKEIKNDQLVIDFNKAYNPYCAYSTGYACPVPPQENDLNIQILAGEKKYTGQVKH